MLIIKSYDLNLENNPTGNNKNIISISIYQKEHVVGLVLSIQCTFSHLFEWSGPGLLNFLSYSSISVPTAPGHHHVSVASLQHSPDSPAFRLNLANPCFTWPVSGDFRIFIMYLFLYLFLAARGSLLLRTDFFQLGQVGALSSCSAPGFSLWCHGFSCCRARARACRLRSCGAPELSPLTWHVGS